MTPSGSIEAVPAESEPEPVASDLLGRVLRPVAITVAPTATLRGIAVSMTANEIGLVVVAARGHLQGVVSERDLVRAIAEEEDLDDVRASDVMSVDLVSVPSSATIADAAHLMLDGGIRHLPVVDDGRVVGVVSIRDLLPIFGQS